MFRKRRLNKNEEARVLAAIGRAERGNRGEVRVHLEGRCPAADPLERAARLFDELGMRETRDDTGVLLYVAERERKAAVYAGSGIHGARESGFWQEVIGFVSQGYAAGQKAEGLELALDAIGALLREVTPGDDSAGDELPNAVSSR